MTAATDTLLDASDIKRITELSELCAHCGGRIDYTNPRGDCDHLYWPERLTREAKRANGFCEVTETVTKWVRE